jgi:hypothetical protein
LLTIKSFALDNSLDFPKNIAINYRALAQVTSSQQLLAFQSPSVSNTLHKMEQLQIGLKVDGDLIQQIKEASAFAK